MDINYTIGLATSSVQTVSLILAAVVGAVILVWAALIGLGFIKKYINHWIGSDGLTPSVMSRSQRNSQYEKFYENKLKGL